MLVSVIIPNYNHAHFLKQRIDSILNQTYQYFEIIILDDCSTDDSKRIIEFYRHNSIVKKIVYNEVNSGSTFKQWQKGIELAKGEWIWIAESDDWCEHNFLETLVNGINTSTAIAVAQSIVVSDDGEILWKSHANFYEKTWPGKDFIQSKLLLDNFGIPNASMCIFKKSLYFNIDDEFVSYQFCGDMLFWILIAIQGEVFVSGKYLNYFRKHNKDVSGSAFKTGLHYLEYFRLLDSLTNRKIIDETVKQRLLKGKLKMFLHDRRLDKNIEQQVKNTFRHLLGKSYFGIVLKFKTAHQIKIIYRHTQPK